MIRAAETQPVCAVITTKVAKKDSESSIVEAQLSIIGLFHVSNMNAGIL